MLDKKIAKIRNIQELLNACEELYGDFPALLIREDNSIKSISYCDMNRIIRRVADYLTDAYGTRKVFVIPGNMSPEWLYVYFGILYSENIAAPLCFEPGDNLAGYLEKLCPDAVVTENDQNDAVLSRIGNRVSDIPVTSLEEICKKAQNYYLERKFRKPSGPETTAMLVFTSGTTGDNKIVEITHRNLCADANLGLEYLGPSYEPGTRFLTALPLYHLYALTSCVMCPLMGGHCICIGGGIGKLKYDIQFFRPDLLMVVPMMLHSFVRKLFPDIRHIESNQLRKGREFFGGKLRLMYCGGAPLSCDYYGTMTLMGIFLANGYGITECSPIISYDNEVYHREGSVGKPGILPEVCSVKIIDGEICVRGEIVSPGYWKEPELNRRVYDADGWFHTGDLGKIDDDGYLFITGRKKNILILPDGNNISLDELERQLGTCPSVEAAIVLGKDTYATPVLEAVVVPKKDTGLSLQELEKQIEKEIEEINRTNPRFKRIAQIRLLDKDFERTALGKVRKFKYET